MSIPKKVFEDLVELSLSLGRFAPLLNKGIRDLSFSVSDEDTAYFIPDENEVVLGRNFPLFKEVYKRLGERGLLLMIMFTLYHEISHYLFKTKLLVKAALEVLRLRKEREQLDVDDRTLEATAYWVTNIIHDILVNTMAENFILSTLGWAYTKYPDEIAKIFDTYSRSFKKFIDNVRSRKYDNDIPTFLVSLDTLQEFIPQDKVEEDVNVVVEKIRSTIMSLKDSNQLLAYVEAVKYLASVIKITKKDAFRNSDLVPGDEKKGKGGGGKNKNSNEKKRKLIKKGNSMPSDFSEEEERNVLRRVVSDIPPVFEDEEDESGKNEVETPDTIKATTTILSEYEQFQRDLKKLTDLSSLTSRIKSEIGRSKRYTLDQPSPEDLILQKVTGKKVKYYSRKEKRLNLPFIEILDISGSMSEFIPGAIRLLEEITKDVKRSLLVAFSKNAKAIEISARDIRRRGGLTNIINEELEELIKRGTYPLTALDLLEKEYKDRIKESVVAIISDFEFYSDLVEFFKRYADMVSKYRIKRTILIIISGYLISFSSVDKIDEVINHIERIKPLIYELLWKEGDNLVLMKIDIRDLKRLIRMRRI